MANTAQCSSEREQVSAAQDSLMTLERASVGDRQMPRSLYEVKTANRFSKAAAGPNS